MGAKKMYYMNNMSWWWTIMGSSFIWTLGALGHAMALVYCASLTSTRIGVGILYTLMNILSTCLATSIMSGMKCL